MSRSRNSIKLRCLIRTLAMTPQSSTLAWKIPWMEEPGRLQSMGLLRVRHDWMTSLSLFTFIYWRRKWQPIPVFLPGESQGWGSLVGCRLWSRTESDTTEVTWQWQPPPNTIILRVRFKHINWCRDRHLIYSSLWLWNIANSHSIVKTAFSET